MTVSLNTTQTRTDDDLTAPASASAPYKVTFTVNSAVGISTSVLVFAVVSDSFDHVAQPLELSIYPDTRAAAVSAGASYYRSSSVTQAFADVNVANDFADMLYTRCNTLVKAYDVATSDFTVGSPETRVISS